MYAKVQVFIQTSKCLGEKMSYPPTITALKRRCTKALRHGRCYLNTYHTPTILLPYTYHTPTIHLLCRLLQNFFVIIEIFRQREGSCQIQSLLLLRRKIAAIKGINIFLGRENFLAGLPVKTPSLPVLSNQ